MPIDVQVAEDRSLTVTIKDLNKGLDSQSESTETSPDHVPGLQNITTQGGYPSGMPGSTLHIAGFLAPDSAAPQMLARYRPPTGTAVYLMACQNGHVYKSADGGATWASIRRGLTTGAASWWSHTQIDEYLVMGNGTDGNLKYDGTRCIPVGAKVICDMESTETWVGGAVDSTNVKQGVRSLKLTTTGSPVGMSLTPATAWDLTSGLFAAPDFADTDYLDFWVYFDTVTGLDLTACNIRLGDVADTNYYQLLGSSWGSLSAGWNHVHALRSAFGSVGSPSWASLAKLTFTLDSTGATINASFDDCYTIYANVMPACQIVREFKGMLLGSSGMDVYYSATGAVDQFDSIDTSVVVIPTSGGSVVTGMHEYADYMLITTDSSVHSLHVQFRNLLYPDYDMTRQEVTSEHGCTSHRSMVMAAGRVWMHWRNNLHAFAGIGTMKTSEIVDPTLADIESTRLEYVVGGRLHDANQLYWWWTPSGGTTNTSGIAYNATQQAFLPIVGRSVSLAETVIESDVEYLLTPDYTGRVLEQNTGTSWDGTAITRFVTLPWISAGRPHPVVSWRKLVLNFETQSSGTLIVEARTAHHPREFTAASYSTIASITMSASTTGADWGGIGFHLRSPWIQIRLRTVEAQVSIYWPITLHGMLQWRRA